MKTGRIAIQGGNVNTRHLKPSRLLAALAAVLFAVSCLAIVSCGDGGSAVQNDPQAEYAAAVLDAETMTAAKLSRDLTALVPENQEPRLGEGGSGHAGARRHLDRKPGGLPELPRPEQARLQGRAGVRELRVQLLGHRGPRAEEPGGPRPRAFSGSPRPSACLPLPRPRPSKIRASSSSTSPRPTCSGPPRTRR